ncbi:hypothetical protein [Marinibactrum halimedae]|uniref:Uncharacterized protein n=1 Tax=Marinibactrum halimedae TaxID=1444977 RepID=A0AA37WMJ9_9GAMM|nr:hypothetical protein [Marinibactrum halimedae]MCD9458739.1 hypothetical protein [Marinibactrum halimedae]GLS25296.1 hypothetical protein GCM10007877_10100 [Marinibactrum halimedae]
MLWGITIFVLSPEGGGGKNDASSALVMASSSKSISEINKADNNERLSQSSSSSAMHSLQEPNLPKKNLQIQSSQENDTEGKDQIDESLPTYFLLNEQIDQQDQFGNYVTELTLAADLSKTLFIVADVPIMPKDGDNRKNKIGCYLGEFTLAYQQAVSVVQKMDDHQEMSSPIIMHYFCDYSDDYGYFLLEEESVSIERKMSVEEIKKNY